MPDYPECSRRKATAFCDRRLNPGEPREGVEPYLGACCTQRDWLSPRHRHNQHDRHAAHGKARFIGNVHRMTRENPDERAKLKRPVADRDHVAHTHPSPLAT
jgi:hypothetical protein